MHCSQRRHLNNASSAFPAAPMILTGAIIRAFLTRKNEYNEKQMPVLWDTAKRNC